MFEQLGLIGCGLMGGSFALAMKKAGLVKRVVGYSKSPSTTDRARQLGVIDVEAPSALLAVAGADIVLLAVPVAATEATLKAIKHLVTPQMLIMDVGSTKADVVQAARRALQGQVGSFVPAHPITGREVSGVEHAEADLYSGRQVILTPTERTLTVQLQRAETIWNALGCRVSSMSPESHDAAFAAVAQGRADAFVSDDISLIDQARLLKGTVKVVGARLSVEPLAPLVSKYAPDFQNLVNQAMKDLYRDGTARQIYKKWFEQPLPGRGYSLDLPPDMLLNDTFRRPDGFVTDWTVL